MFGNKLGKVAKAIEKGNAKVLVDLASDNDVEVKLAAIAGLGETGGEDATNFLITQLHDNDSAIRIAVAKSLGVLGDMHTKAHVSAQMNKETNPEVREALSKAMAGIKGY